MWDCLNIFEIFENSLHLLWLCFSYLIYAGCEIQIKLYYPSQYILNTKSEFSVDVTLFFFYILFFNYLSRGIFGM